MKFCDVEAFLAIVRSGSISQAAASLYISQPTVSGRLRALEQELGTSLIRRKKGTRNIELTSKGEIFVPIAEQWIALNKSAHQIRYDEPVSTLTVGSPESLTNYRFFPFYQMLAREEPSICLEIRNCLSYEVYNLLRFGEIDIGFVYKPIESKSVITKPLFFEPLRLICHSEASFEPGPINPRELNPRNEIFFYWNEDFQRWHDLWWDPRTPSYIRIDAAATVLSRFINDARLWTICPSSIADEICDGTKLVQRDLTNEPPGRTCYLIERRNYSPPNQRALTLFKMRLSEYLTSIPVSDQSNSK